jgi:predicted small secreted protein
MTMKLVRTLTVAALLCGVAVAIAGCNTTKGAGKDIEAAGQGIENSASKHGAD